MAVPPPRRTLRNRVRGLLQEWAARRAGRRHVPNDLGRHARDVAGVTGWMYSRGWDEIGRVGPAYLRSFEQPRVPPSLHVSARDRRRDRPAIPLVERCIEDFGTTDATEPGPWSVEELDRSALRGSRARRSGWRRPSAPGPGA